MQVPRGLIRHSSLPVPTVPLSWQRVLDEEPSDLRSDAYPDALYYSEAILALVFRAAQLAVSKGRCADAGSDPGDVDHVNYWMPYRDGDDVVLFVTPDTNRSVPAPLRTRIDVGFASLRAQCMGREAGRGGQRSPARSALWCQPPLRQSLVFLTVPCLQMPEAYISDIATCSTRRACSRIIAPALPSEVMTAFADWVERNAERISGRHGSETPPS